MHIVLIAAMARNRVIGCRNHLPWHLPADLHHFKRLTMGKPILMGRKTFESIGKPLPGRQNIVLTRAVHEPPLPGCVIAHTVAEALALAEPKNELMVIGGAKLFHQTLPLASRMYLTFIDAELEGDTYFPAWDRTIWKETARENHEPDEKNPYRYRFVTLERQKLPAS